MKAAAMTRRCVRPPSRRRSCRARRCQAADYPAHPITLVVPYAAGGGNDVIARIVAEKMSASLGQSVVIENRGGAGGTIATRQVAKAEPDGYTLLIATSSLAINPSLYPNAGYDPRKDFAPIGLIASSSNVVLVQSIGAGALDRGTDRAGEARRTASSTFASTGTGSSVHLAAELFAGMAGVKINHVPYKGSGPALNDLLGGHVAMMFCDHGERGGARPRRQQGARAGGDRARSGRRCSRICRPSRRRACPATRRCCTMASSRRPARRARWSKSSTPRSMRRWATREVKRRLAVEGAEALPASPDAYAADIAGEETKWSEIIRKAGVKGE